MNFTLRKRRVIFWIGPWPLYLVESFCLCIYYYLLSRNLQDDTNTEVVLRPDYIIYQDNYYTGPMLTFSHSCIKINVSTACMEHEAFDLEWGIDDLIDIKCQSIQSVSFIALLLALFVFCV